MQQIQLNIIPITPVVGKLKFGFYGDKILNEFLLSGINYLMNS